MTFEVENDSCVKNKHGNFVRFGSLTVELNQQAGKVQIWANWKSGTSITALSLTPTDAAHLFMLIDDAMEGGATIRRDRTRTARLEGK